MVVVNKTINKTMNSTMNSKTTGVINLMTTRCSH
jgi:hypothetical protein